MKNKIIILLILIPVIVTVFFALNFDKGDDDTVNISQAPAQEKITIAACPTCFALSEKLATEKYHVIATETTAQSIALLESGQVDMIVAGRTLKPHEPQLDYMVIGEGYSFLSNQERVVYIDQLKNEPVYTDISPEIITDILPIQQIKHVVNVYEYLDQGIVVTSWDNTDYSNAEVVHVLEENGERVALSRRPTVYCPHACDSQAQELALTLQ